MTLALGGSRWHTFPATGTVMTARAFLTALEPLLQGVIDDNSLTAADGPVLEAQIHATLALGARESALPLRAGPGSSRAARELAGRAEAIGRELATLATEAVTRLLDDRIELAAGPLVVRSHCYGHLLTPDAADLLLRRRGGPVTMQLYNEWLHQVVLLRDALLPFTAWPDVPLFVGETGLRHLEPARDAFLTELLVRQVRHSSIVRFARQAVTGADGPFGYGFDAPGGTTLPAVLDQSPLTAPRYLLTWRPDATVRTTATYTYELPDYYAAPRTPAGDLTPADATGPLTARVVTGQPGPAWIEVTDGREVTRVDLGQALRGHRFARIGPAAGAAHGGEGPEAGPAAHGGEGPGAGAWTVLRAPGLVQPAGDPLVVDAAGQDGLVVLALLGRLYPEDVTLRSAGDRGARVVVRL
ncbi:hypothetical protein [Paractinoplanes lichenicola]|uniref:Uncharacterized protein n=1 Tax=Paractinoplanes lichenicola TaxID=2802976 RepID=A0ABS1VEQ3_9ACTN|nr:hypothetical protein [Actinoplanes lichenicola]MBL7253166.1 hypothetical protein [Actinoplanes lichenicola]